MLVVKIYLPRNQYILYLTCNSIFVVPLIYVEALHSGAFKPVVKDTFLTVIFREDEIWTGYTFGKTFKL